MSDTDVIIDAMHEAIREAMDETGPSGLAMTIVTDKEIVWTEAFGHLDKMKKAEVNKATLFSIQSTSKLVNAIVFMLAVQDGIIHLDDPLVKYFPEFRVKSRWGLDEEKKITFRHLLTHHSGLPQMTRRGSCFDDSPHTFQEHIHSIIDTWLESPVGSRFSYSNIGMDLVSYAIEKASGIAFPEYVNKKLAEPLGISIVYGSIEAKKNPNRVIGYEHPEIPIPIGTALAYGCGGVWMNIEDLAVLTQFLLNGGKHDEKQILRGDLLDAIMTRQIEGDEGYTIGFGAHIIQGGNVRIVEHAGGGFGYGSLLAIAPDYGVGAVVEINKEDVNLVYTLVLQALDLLLKQRGIERKMPVKEDFMVGEKQDGSKPEITRLAGYYRGVWGGVFVKVNEGKLSIMGQELSPHNSLTFSGDGFPPLAQFTMNDANPACPLKVTLLTSKVGPVDLFFQEPLQIEEESSDAAGRWDTLTGLYRTHYYGIHMTYIAIQVQNGRLTYKDWSEPIPLYPIESEDMTFFTSTGMYYVFEEGQFRHSNRLAMRVDDPVGDVLDAVKQGKPTPMLTDWVMNQEIRLLEFLGRKDEAEEISKIRTEIHGK